MDTVDWESIHLSIVSDIKDRVSKIRDEIKNLEQIYSELVSGNSTESNTPLKAKVDTKLEKKKLDKSMLISNNVSKKLENDFNVVQNKRLTLFSNKDDLSIGRNRKVSLVNKDIISVEQHIFDFKCHLGKRSLSYDKLISLLPKYIDPKLKEISSNKSALMDFLLNLCKIKEFVEEGEL